MKENYPIVVLGAMDAEVEAFVSRLENPEKADWHGAQYWRGVLHGKPTVISKSGVGKVAAAMTAQHLIDLFAPRFVLFTGVGGGISSKLNIGDVVVARDCVQHDMDGRAMGFARGNIPYTHYSAFECDEQLRKIALNAKIKNTVVSGRVATGDVFISGKNFGDYSYLTEELNADVVEMEGAATAQVCTLNKVPFLVIRTVSDKADDNAKVDFEAFLPVAANNALVMVEHIFKHI